MLENRTALDILATSITHPSKANVVTHAYTHDIVFGLRTRVICYPENICAVWIMLAVRYREFEGV